MTAFPDVLLNNGLRLRSNIERTLDRWNEEIEKEAFAKKDQMSEVELKGYIAYLIRDRDRWRCRNDLFFLCEQAGFSKVVEVPRIYRPFCDLVSLGTWKVVQLGIHKPSAGMLRLDEVVDSPDILELQRLFLCFRAFYKSTVITVAHTVQLLLNFENLHIALCHNKHNNASDNLMAVKRIFQTTEVGKMFPEVIPPGKEWGNSSEFSLATRRDWHISEHNVMAVGIGDEITGKHWQYAKKNDLVTEDTVTTKEQIQKTLDWDARFNVGHFHNAEQCLQDYEGTRYHFADMYSRLKGNPRIQLIEIPIMADEQDMSTIYLPERFTPDGIENLKSNPWVFYCQMMLEPKDPEKMGFSPNMIRYIENPPRMTYCLLIDPASKRKKKSDFTVMLVVGIDKDNNRYIVDGIRDKLDPVQRLRTIRDLCYSWTIKEIGWETIGFQETDAFNFEEMRRKEKALREVHVTEIDSHNVSKEDRIRALIPEYHAGRWFWPKKGAVVRQGIFSKRSYDLTEEMEYEFVSFPLAEHDDLLDAMTFIHRIHLQKPEEEKEEESQGMTFGQYVKQMDDRKKALRQDPWSKLRR